MKLSAYDLYHGRLEQIEVELKKEYYKGTRKDKKVIARLLGEKARIRRGWVTVEKWMEEYNFLLARNAKAEEFLNSCTNAQYEKWYPEFEKITMKLSKMITIHGIKEENVLKGFCMAPDYPDEKPQYQKVVEKCIDCGGNIFEDDEYYEIEGNSYCSECIKSRKRYASVEG